MLNDTDHNKQRAAAELTAGVIGGSKHWPADAQDSLWALLKLIFDKTLGSNVKQDTLQIWTSFLEVYSNLRHDTSLTNLVSRRSTNSTAKILVEPLIDHVLENFKNCAFDGELSFDATKWASFTWAFYEEIGWRSVVWMDEVIGRYWFELNSEHDEVRAYIADVLEFSGKVAVSHNR